MPNDNDLIPVFIPALITTLIDAEKKKRKPLTQSEVEKLRDNAVTTMLPRAQARTLANTRGYTDLNSEKAWEQWQKARTQLHKES